MKTFEAKIKRIKRKRLGIAGILLLIAAILLIWAIIEVIPKEIEYGEFNRDDKTTQYAKTKIYYLTGPIIKATNTKTGEVFKYYVATGINDEIFVVRTGEETDLPIYGIDVTEENKETIEATEIYGIPQLTSGSLIDALNIELNLIFQEEIANKQNFTQVMGAYHLDTIGEPTNIAGHLLIVSALIGSIGASYLYINRMTRKKVNTCLEELTSKGNLEEVINEYEGGQLIEYRKIKVSLSPKYLFYYGNGLDVIEIKNIKEVSLSKKKFTNRNQSRYIVVTMKDDVEIGIAPFKKKAEKVVANELLAKIKSIIE